MLIEEQLGGWAGACSPAQGFTTPASQQVSGKQVGQFQPAQPVRPPFQTDSWTDIAHEASIARRKASLSPKGTKSD